VRTSWFYILLSLLTADRHGAGIEDDVRALSDGRVRLWPATLYGSLEELTQRGWIRELDEGENPDDASHRSRFYRLLPEGRATLVAELERREAVTRVARARLEDSGS
jgi:DNA-binding PadR family transcriptional regulator